MSDIVYNPLSQVTQLKIGAATGNTDIEQYSYDAQTGLLTNQKVIKQNSNQTLLDLSYNYNRGNSKGSLNGKTGQLTNVVDNLNRNKDRVYEFDTLGRLITDKGGVAAGGSGTANWTQNYSFDRYGNRTAVNASGITQNSQTVPTDGLPTQSYDNNSNRITTAGYIYDLAGNLIRGQKPDGSWQRFGYDTTGRLVRVDDDAGNQVEGYAYASSRQRLVKNDGTWTYYAWGGSSVIAEYTSAGWGATLNWAKSYIYAGSRLLSTFTKNGGGEKLEFHHPDRLGTRLVTNDTANTSFEQNTLPFGTALDAETTGSTNQRFTSYDRSQVANLDYAVNRSYSSGQGRFTSVDPIAHVATLLVSPQTLNLYSYVGNNPIDKVDPTGLFSLNTQNQNKCYFNINLTDSSRYVDSQMLWAMRLEMTKIFGDAGVTLVFNNPKLGNSGLGSYNLTLVDSYPGVAGKEMIKQGGNPNDSRIIGFTSSDNPGNGWINVSHMRNQGIQINGYSLGRVGSHEGGHFALGHNAYTTESSTIHPSSSLFVDRGIMSPGYMSKNPSSPDLTPAQQASHRFNAIQTIAWRLGCRKPNQSIVSSTQPSGGGGDGGGGGDYTGGSYRLYNNGWSSLDWLWWQYERERDGWGEPKILD